MEATNKILFIEDEAVATDVRGGKVETPMGSVLDYSMVVYRSGKGYEVLRCSFAYPESFITAAVANSTGEVPAIHTDKVAGPGSCAAIIHTTVPGMVLATMETPEEVTERILASVKEDMPFIKVTSMITFNPTKEGEAPRYEWGESTLMLETIAALQNFLP